MRKWVHWSGLSRAAAGLAVAALLAATACTSTPTATQPPPATATVAAASAAQATPAPAASPGGTAMPAATAPTAATEASASPTSSAATTATVQTVSAGEVVKLAGNSFTNSDTYRFGADTTLDVSWNYTGTAPFALWLINVSENVTDPNYDRILIDDITGPHSGTAKQKIIAGDWQIEVEQAEGPWTVQFSPES